MSTQGIPFLRSSLVFFLLATLGAALQAQTTTPQQKEKLLEILARQKGEDLRVYLNARSAYINGKTVAESEILAVARKSHLNRAVVSPESYVAKERVKEIRALLRGVGLSVKVQTVERPKPDPEAVVREILGRQKGEELRVYLNSRSAYINGQSVSTTLLTMTARKSRLEKGVISAEANVTREKIKQIRDLLQQSGVNKVKVASLK